MLGSDEVLIEAERGPVCEAGRGPGCEAERGRGGRGIHRDAGARV